MHGKDNNVVCSGTTRQRRRLLIAADRQMLVDMLRILLQSEFEVVATDNDGPGLAEQIAEICPDIVLVDTSMSGCSAVEAVRRIRALGLPVRPVCFTTRTDPEIASEAFAAGASGYLLKSESTSQFLQALHIVGEGERYLTPAILGGNIEALPSPKHEGSLAQISSRTCEVLKLVASGLSMKAVAIRLGITPRTVAFHKYKAMAMLGLKDNAQLLDFALRHGLLHDDGIRLGK